MKGRNLFLLGLGAILLGVLLIIFRASLANGKVVLIAGTLFVVAGVMNMTVFLGSRDKNGKARMGAFGTVFGWLASAAATILGLAMLIFSTDFVAITGFMFAVLILFAALFQLFLIAFGARPTALSPWLYLVPAALVGAALYIIFLRQPTENSEHIVMLVTGISLLIFGLSTIIEGAAVGQINRQAKHTPDDRPDKESAGKHQAIPETGNDGNESQHKQGDLS